MISHIAAFIFYTLAMIGVLVVGYVVYKKTNLNLNFENKSMIKILDSVAIAPKKNLLVVKIKNEKFLIASGQEHTTFLAKLEDDVQISQSSINEKIEEEPKYYSNNEEITDKIKEKFQIAKNQKELEKEFEEKKQNKLQNLQKQFMDLYYKDTKEKMQSRETTSKFAKTILKELEEKKYQNGSKF